MSVSFTELRTTRQLIWLQPLPSCSAAQCSWGSCEAPTGAVPGWVEVLIRDNGIGMSHLREGSLGYGLVRALVEQIRGEITIQNGDGLAVTISFPDSS